MIHLDLFSGIGGFAYAADQVWDNVEHIFCDNDPFCRQVLNKHWPEATIYGDIRSITNTDSCRSIGEKGKSQDQKCQGLSCLSCHNVDLLTGGFPCQPFSAAGLRRGTADERHLWPEMLRVIQLTRPTWVIAENVRGILTWNDGLVFEQVCADLEGAGYEVQPFIIPAVAVNAPHRRDRIWFVAHAENTKWRAGQLGQAETSIRPSRNHKLAGSNSHASHAETKGLQQSREGGRQIKARDARWRGFTDNYSWQDNWLEVAAELCGVDDGLSIRMDGFELTKSAHRKERLKALGNAIVPQVAMEIMKGMT